MLELARRVEKAGKSNRQTLEYWVRSTCYQKKKNKVLTAIKIYRNRAKGVNTVFSTS